MLASAALESLRRRTSLPNSQELFSDNDLIGFFNDENQSTITPFINKTREEYFTTHKDFSVTPGNSMFSIPSRAFQGSIRDVQVIENGNARSLVRYWEEDRGRISAEGFFVVGNKIELFPVPKTSFTLRILFDRRPSVLVPILDTARINAIDVNNSQVTVDSLPSAIVNGSIIDLVSQKSPHPANDDLEITGISGLTLTLSNIPDDLEVGDYVCLKEQTPFIQLTPEHSNLLIQAVSVKIYESLQKYDAMRAAGEVLQMQMKQLSNVMNPRVVGEAKKVVSRQRRW